MEKRYSMIMLLNNKYVVNGEWCNNKNSIEEIIFKYLKNFKRYISDRILLEMFNIVSGEGIEHYTIYLFDNKLKKYFSFECDNQDFNNLIDTFFEAVFSK